MNTEKTVRDAIRRGIQVGHKTWQGDGSWVYDTQYTLRKIMRRKQNGIRITLKTARDWAQDPERIVRLWVEGDLALLSDPPELHEGCYDTQYHSPGLIGIDLAADGGLTLLRFALAAHRIPFCDEAARRFLARRRPHPAGVNNVV